jgi:cytochrome c oxidase subunit II
MVGVLATALLVLSGCAGDAPQDIFKAEGNEARKITDLNFVFWIAVVVGILVLMAVTYVIVRFRQDPERPEAVPAQIHGNTKLEIMWTIAPAVLLVFVAVPTIATIFDLADQPDDAMEINVIGQQWWWEFGYTENLKGIVTANEMVIPAGEEVVVNITSRDVIHSFWVPRLNGKKDAVPGRVHRLTFHADEPGEYWGQCAEFCGLSHANMRIRVVALSAADFDRWTANQLQPAVTPAAGSAAERGLAVYNQQCANCHMVTGGGAAELPGRAAQVSGAAPNLTHLMSRTTFAGAMFDLKDPSCSVANDMPTGTPVECLNRPQLENWLRNAPKEKAMYPPTRGMPALGLNEAQIDDLVEYLSTLK